MTVPKQTYPSVSKLIDRFGSWLAHRRDMAEMAHMNSDEFGRIANDLGIAAADLDDLVRNGPHRIDELPQLLKALGIDETALARAEPFVLRDMERVCAMSHRHFAQPVFLDHALAGIDDQHTTRPIDNQQVIVLGRVVC